LDALQVNGNLFKTAQDPHIWLVTICKEWMRYDNAWESVGEDYKYHETAHIARASSDDLVMQCCVSGGV
jgi:hypothetical protein